jgi:hypothetical protein
MSKLAWTGQEGYNAAPTEDWSVSRSPSGWVMQDIEESRSKCAISSWIGARSMWLCSW